MKSYQRAPNPVKESIQILDEEAFAMPKGNLSGNYDSFGKMHCKATLSFSALRFRRTQLFPDW
jgi:hypothetical protein